MSVTKVIQYTTKPECSDENERLIRAVFAELAEQNPEGLRYSAFRLDDGGTFLHVATLDGKENPLTTLAAFRAFQSAISDRCVVGPNPVDAIVVGSFGT
jgi:hypothetical protein